MLQKYPNGEEKVTNFLIGHQNYRIIIMKQSGFRHDRRSMIEGNYR